MKVTKMHQVRQTESNRLAVLAAGIRAESKATSAAIKRGVEHAMAAGELLLEAKGLLKHGQWLPWLSDHCALSERTARLYMRLASNRTKIKQEIGNVADLSVRAAIALITAPKTNAAADLARQMADEAVDEMTLADLDARALETAKRRSAFSLIKLAIDEIKLCSIAEALFDLYGAELLSAIKECNELLHADQSAQATIAILRAKDIALEMIEHLKAA